MKLNSIFFIQSLFMCFIMIFCTVINKPQVEADDFASGLKRIYQSLSLSKTGRNYPPSEDIAKDCKSLRDGCFKTLDRVQGAKQALLSRISADPERTLKMTLASICLKCGRNENEMTTLEDEQECLGALTALYYFRRDDQDQRIMDNLLKASPTVLEWVTAFRYEWFYNRPHPNQWIGAIEKMPADRIGRALKENMLYEFKEAAKGTEKFGVMLLDP